jgi:hypothetical protein
MAGRERNERRAGGFDTASNLLASAVTEKSRLAAARKPRVRERETAQQMTNAGPHIPVSTQD